MKSYFHQNQIALTGLLVVILLSAVYISKTGRLCAVSERFCEVEIITHNYSYSPLSPEQKQVVDRLLQNNKLDPNDLIPQYYSVDKSGKQRVGFKLLLKKLPVMRLNSPDPETYYFGDNGYLLNDQHPYSFESYYGKNSSISTVPQVSSTIATKSAARYIPDPKGYTAELQYLDTTLVWIISAKSLKDDSSQPYSVVISAEDGRVMCEYYRCVYPGAPRHAG